MENLQKRTLSIIEIGATLLFLLFIGSGVVQSPFFGNINVIDEGQFAAWVSQMLHGKILYKEIYTAYGPLYIYPFYELAKIFDPSVFLMRILYKVIFVFISIVVVKRLLQKLDIRYPIQLVCLAAVLIIPDFGLRQGIGLFSLLVLVTLFESKAYRVALLLGVSVVVSLLISIEIGIFVSCISLLFYIVTIISEKHPKKTVLLSLTTLIASAFSVLLFYLWSTREGWFLFYVQTTLSDLKIFSGIDLPNGQNFPNIFVLAPKSYDPFVWFKFIFSKQMLLYWLFIFYIISFLYIIYNLLFHNKHIPLRLISVLVLFGFLISTILVGRSGHFSFVLAPVFILLAFFADQLIKKYVRVSSMKEKAIITSIVVTCLFFTVRIVAIYRTDFPKVFQLPGIIYNGNATIPFVGPIVLPSEQRNTISEVQHFIFNNTTQDDMVFFAANEPIMYMLVSRNNPTRYDYPYIAGTIEKRLEILSDLESNPPKYILYNMSAWDVDGVSNIKRMPEVWKHINTHYMIKKHLGSVLVYQRKIQ
ncbi:MAG: hypothetical protein RLZZ455_1069 [Candidatus Parcubacteria bacterium]|jgi:hypothetical protein